MLSIRQKNILKFIIIEYTNTVLPVGSELISQNAKLNVSPATIRKELIELESKAYITRPHSSAGSIPLDKGYRYYIENTEKFWSSTLRILDGLFPKILNWPAGIVIVVVELETVVLPVGSIKSYQVVVTPAGKLVFTNCVLTSKLAKII